MRQKDEFDDTPLVGAVNSIFSALDLRSRIAERGPLFTVLPLLVMVLILVGVLWYSYPRESARQELQSVPIIHADASAYKIVPSDPGGMDIPYRESTVFDALRSAKEDGSETLSPETEKPIEREDLFAGLKTELPAEEEPAVVQETAAPPVVAAEPPPAEALASAPLPAARPEIIIGKTREVARKAAATEPASGVDKQGKYYIQLGSVTSRAAAEKGWQGFQSEFPALAELSLRVQEADLGAKGMYYRMQAGPLSEASAKSLCQTVTARRPGGCLVVRP